MPDTSNTFEPETSRKAGAVERRARPREAAFGSSIQLGWWEGHVFRTASGLLKDVSRCGAAALAEAAPPKGAKVLFRLSGARHTDWVESSIVEVTKNRWFRRVPRLVRVQFHEPCPYHVFQAALDVLVMECRTDEADQTVHGRHIARRHHARTSSERVRGRR